MTNYLRTNYRLAGKLIDDQAIMLGSSATSAAATAAGTVTIAHGMGTAPTVAFGNAYASSTLAVYRYVALKGIDSVNLTFVTASSPPVSSQTLTTQLAGAQSSGIVMTFVWMAIK